MKQTKKIMFVLSALILNTIVGLAAASVTDSAMFGFILGGTGMATSVVSMVKPNLTYMRGAFQVFNPAQITWDGKEVMDIQGTIFETVFKNPELSTLNLIVEGIVAKQQIVFMGLMSKITKKQNGCDSTPTNNNVPSREQFWDPTATEFWLQACASELEQSFFVWGLNKGIERLDLTNTDFGKFVMERMQTALMEDVMRLAWFNDKDAENYNGSPAGHITNTVSIDDYNIIDGIWKRLFIIGADDPTKVTAISRNAQASGSQDFTDQDITDKVITNTFRKIKRSADTRLTEQEANGLQYYVTRSVYEQYEDELGSFANIEGAWTMLQTGVKTLNYKGIPVVKISFWDRTLAADFKAADGKIYLPHRILLTVKENIPIGVDSKSDLDKTDNWYSKDTKKNNWRGGYKVDTQVLEPYMVAMGY